MNPSLKAALNEVGSRPLSAIAERHGLSAGYLRKMASNRGISTAFILQNVVKKPWSLDEEAFLKQNASTLTAEQIGNELNRTAESIKSKARKLKVCLQKHGEQHHLAKYSDHDVELCRQLDDAGLKPYEIAEKMELDYSYVQCILNYRIRIQS